MLLAHLAGTRNFPNWNVFTLYGNFGVRVFFVISGYLITSLLLNEQAKTGTISLANFYLRRVYRIFPAAYAFMFIAIAANWTVLSWPNILTAVTYTSNYYHVGHWILGHLWSLSVEEQFYLLWPLTLLLFFNNRLAILTGAIVAGPPLRILFWLCWGNRGLQHPFPVVMDALAMGCALAVLGPKLKGYEKFLLSRWCLLVSGITMLMPLLQIYSNRAYQVVGLTVMHAGIAMSIEHAIRIQYAILNWPPAVWLGKLSYSLYLWQQPFLNRNSPSVWAKFPLNLAIALICATVSYWVVEQPFLKLRARTKSTHSTCSRHNGSRSMAQSEKVQAA